MCPMKSALAIAAREASLVEALRMTPEERLNAFLVHCRLVMELQRAAGAGAAAAAVPPSANHRPIPSIASR